MARWTERDAEEYLLGLELFGMRFGLERMHRLTTALGMPQRRFAQVHVVGSNGKSSTVRFIAALLERYGLSSGSYTSPHLTRFRERIEVGEAPIPADRFATAVERAAEAATLVERELSLDAQQEEFRHAERQWQADRRRYEQQIRDLSTQLRTLPVAA